MNSALIVTKDSCPKGSAVTVCRQVYQVSPIPMVVSTAGGVDTAGAETKVWQLETEQCLQSMSDHTHWVMSAQNMPIPSGQMAGQYLCTGSLDGTVKVYKMGTTGFEPLHNHDVSAALGQPLDACRITAMLLTADPAGTPVLATALCGGVLVLWDVPAFTQRCIVPECGSATG